MRQRPESGPSGTEMKTKEFFRFSLRSPELTPEEEETEKKRREYEDLISRAGNALDAFSLLMDAGLYRDAYFQLHQFKEAVTEVILYSYKSKKTVKKKKPEEILQLSRMTGDLNETSDLKKELRKLHPEISDFWKKISAAALKEIRSDYTTPRDIFYQRIVYQIVTAAVLIFFAVVAVFFLKLDAHLINDIDQAVLYYTENPGAGIRQSRSSIHTVKLTTNWSTVTHSLPKPETIRRVRISPVSQPKLRFQIREIRFYGRRHELKYVQSMVYNENSENFLKRVIGQGMKSGRLVWGEPAELISTGKQNYLDLKHLNLYGIRKVEYDIRFVTGSDPLSETDSFGKPD